MRSKVWTSTDRLLELLALGCSMTERFAKDMQSTHFGAAYVTVTPPEGMEDQVRETERRTNRAAMSGLKRRGLVTLRDDPESGVRTWKITKRGRARLAELEGK